MKSWTTIIEQEKQKPYFQQILQFIEQERQTGKTIFPPKNEIFSAFDLTPFEKVKVVILGQDPYHGIHQAHGLAFSVKPHIAIPRSLANIYKELQQDLQIITPKHGNLIEWAKQGVLLLNTVLTVEEGKANSHAKIGWETFTDQIIKELNIHREHLVFLLWGNHAQKKGQKIDPQRHCILTAPHPSPLSARHGFFGCQHFSKTNAYLRAQGIQEIQWQLPLTL